ncbi:hypothetical protein D9756_000985 [Leucocoprinus leucothites]|uniref:O-methyltransferase domain-containing protein n=1 Tax=Leucocoprinus leucothites TaxID=201217 RepID=A0A8H5GFV1_9AGAR|nr:hypothetical protein D9756_000985 [Leucoagaricus leucothites]
MSEQANISGLVSLIAGAAGKIESYYTANPAKPYVPPLSDTEPHPLDSKIYPLDVRKAVQTLEGACAQLCATLVRPNHTVLNRHLNIYQTAYLSVALRAQVADILLDEPAGLHVSEISKRCKIEEKKLARILRTLCSQHIFREVSRDTFANNRLSMLFLSSDPLSSMGLHISDEPTNKSAVHLADTLLDPEWGFSDAPGRSSFNYAFGTPDSMFRYFEGRKQKDNPKAAEQGAQFGRAMIGGNAACDASAIITGYPWGELSQGATVNDVGGGVGHISMELCKRYKNLNLKLQDLPERIEQAEKDFWPKGCPEAIADGRIGFKPIDLLAEKPIAHCDIYLLKNVIHLMSDEVAIKALSNVRSVMSPTSRVLVQEFILQSAVRVSDDEIALGQADPPLLPNYGVGRIRQYYFDAIMMVLQNGQERSSDDFIRIGKRAGLELVKIWDLGETSAVEFAPAGLEK